MAVSASAIAVVDDVLKKLAERGLVDAGMSPRPPVTVAPLDHEAEAPRLNWFLYRVAPNAAYRNMESPVTGTRTARGTPPLALTLQYLLTAYAADPTATGDQQQIAHVALAGAMRRLQDSAIVAEGSPFLPTPAPALLEPLRITLDDLDLDTLSKLWTASTRPLRVSVGYTVSLAVVEPQQTHAVGPPVRERRVAVLPSAGARLRGVEPARVGGSVHALVVAEGLVRETVLTLAAEPGDPAGAPADGWPLVEVERVPEGVVVALPRPDLLPGVRRIDAVTRFEGLPAGGDSIAVTVVPTIVSVAPSPAAVGATVTLTAAHCAPDTEVFLDGTAVAATVLGPTSVTFVVPPGSEGQRAVSLRSRRAAGPGAPLLVTP